MKIYRKTAAFAAVLVMTILLSIHASADEKLGSVEIRMAKGGIPVAGGSMILYPVAEWKENQYRVVDAFAMYDGDALDWKNPDTARKLLQYAQREGVSGNEQTISESGTAVFTELREGLYLIVQRNPAKGYVPVAPFMISVPTTVGENKMYHVTAYPKCMEEIKGESPHTGQPLLPYYLFYLSGSGLVWMMLHIFKGGAMKKQ